MGGIGMKILYFTGTGNSLYVAKKIGGELISIPQAMKNKVFEYEDEKIGIVDALIKVYNSFISKKIDDYNSSVYYENPSYIFECYKENKML